MGVGQQQGQHSSGVVRIFLASSAELEEHRREFRQFIADQNDLPTWKQRGIRFEVVRWEHFIDAMSDTRLQDEYNKAVASCDVFVMLYRTKVGKYTAEEFETAFERFKNTGRPKLYTYLHRTAVDLDTIDLEDVISLKAFQGKLKTLGHFQTGYANHDQLCRHFGDQLAQLDGTGYLRPHSVSTPGPADIASLPARPAKATLAQLRPYLSRRSAYWRTGAAGQLDRRFVNLTLMVDHGLEHDGPRREAVGRYDLLRELLAERADVSAWVLVGAPGSGKSTVLQHHEMSSAAQSLLAAEGGGPVGDAPPELCILQRLSEYSVDSPPPDEWLALPARWPHDLPPLAALHGVARVRFLLDGLNEIKAPDRSRQLDAIDRWTEWAAAHASQGDQLAPLFSVRTLDQSPLSTKDFEVRQIVLAPWQAEQIEAYCEHTLGPGNGLWPVIERDPALLQLSELPFNLAAQCALFNTLGRAANDRAELMGGLFWHMLAKRVADAPLKVTGLLGEQDRQLIASSKWKEKLHALPDQYGCLVPWLDQAMQGLHRRGQQVSVAQAELLAELTTTRPGWATPEQWLQAVRSLQLIAEGGSDEFSTAPLLRCAHQLWQEFFAARGIRQLAASDPAELPDLRPPELPALDTTMAKLGAQEPLPGPDPSHWEEPIKLAVLLVPDPQPWIQVLQPLNLALSARAAHLCRARAETLHGKSVFDGLRQSLLTRSRDPAVDLRLRIEAAEALGELGDPRYLQGTGPKGHRYLLPKPVHWVKVPAGRYTIGCENGHTDETPLTRVDLASFHIAFAPVTNAEYSCFIEAGGYNDERWWQGDSARRWRREGIRSEELLADWKVKLAALRADFDLGVMQYFAGEPQSFVDGDLRHYASWSEDQANTNLEHSFGGQVCREPAHWRDTRFNHACKPVVGISLYESCAYACWLAAQCGNPIALPVEAQWEAAARGTAARRWPSGEADPEPGQINADSTHLRCTSPAGVFPKCDSPEGLTDMAGNVLEWTTSAYNDRHEHAKLINKAPDGAARRVVRGGAWTSTADYCRGSSRGHNAPGDRYYNLGFRLVSCPTQGTTP